MQLKPGLTPVDCSIEVVVHRCPQLFAPFRMSRRYVCVDTFPCTSSNRIAKHILRGLSEDLRRGSYNRLDAVWRR